MHQHCLSRADSPGDPSAPKTCIVASEVCGPDALFTDDEILSFLSKASHWMVAQQGPEPSVLTSHPFSWQEFGGWPATAGPWTCRKAVSRFSVGYGTWPSWTQPCSALPRRGTCCCSGCVEKSASASLWGCVDCLTAVGQGRQRSTLTLVQQGAR